MNEQDKSSSPAPSASSASPLPAPEQPPKPRPAKEQADAEPLVVDAAVKEKSTQKSPRTGGGWVSTSLGLLALLVAAGAGAGAFHTWQQLNGAKEALARQTEDVRLAVTEATQTANSSDALSKELQARLTVAEVKLSEVSLQRSQLEELMLSLSRSRDDNLVQDLESSIRLAQQQAVLTGSAQPLISALQAADQRIARAAQPRLNPVQRAIARDIETIQAATLADIPALVVRLDEMARSVDEWPVLNEVGPLATVQPGAASRVTTDTGPEPASEAQAPSSDVSSTAVGDATSAVSASGDRFSELMNALSAFGGKVWDAMSEKGRELVRVSRVDRPEAALLAPEQAFFLRENTKLRLLNARLGLLARQMDSAQADLQSVESSIDRYFDSSSAPVAQAKQMLAELRQEVATTGMPRPEETLTALATAAGGR
ncbi:uroporphyrinogen-III C-methyltransferase [Hydrogenophaga sp. 5NK40-0174]|uniref:uroporphyrinogen-III C-methyltransferase n=1 Tax=Hydrogenophaga sp. 5NK40-0174 TaxID=3127649 RepID=UPI003108EF54